MRLLIIFSLFVAALGAQTTSVVIGPSVTGTVKLSDGSASKAALLSFYPEDTSLPVVHTPVHADGSYTTPIASGTYQVCVQPWDVPGLNPCAWNSWMDEPKLTVTIPLGASEITYPIVLTKGEFLRLQVDDPQRVLSKTTLAPEQDIYFGVMTTSGFVVRSTLERRDQDGLTLRAIVPKVDGAQPVLLLNKLKLATSIGLPLKAGVNDVASLLSALTGLAPGTLQLTVTGIAP